MTAAFDDLDGAEQGAVAVAAGGGAWEGALIDQLTDPRWRLVVLRRCLDVADLLAFASTGAVRLAVVAEQLPGLDADALARLRAEGVRVVAVSLGGWSSARLRELGVADVLDSTHLADGVGPRLRAVLDAEEGSLLLEAKVSQPRPPAVSSDGAGSGRLVAVWGAHGAPGRTTVAVGLAAELAGRDVGTLLVDADPYGGSVSQHLGLLEEVSGLLSAARLANSGDLDPERLAAMARTVTGAGGLTVLTGLPRPDRWSEVRPAALKGLLRVATQTAPVTLLDVGFGVGGADEAAGPSRDELVAVGLEVADHVVAVASADPIGLTRLARNLSELRARRRTGPDLVVVNRMRRGLGWSQREIIALVEGLAPHATVCFLPDDRDAADRALAAGRTLGESKDSPLRRAMGAVTDQLGEVLALDAEATDPGTRARSRFGRRGRG